MRGTAASHPTHALNRLIAKLPHSMISRASHHHRVVSPQVRQALIDMEAMFELKELQPKVTDRPNAQPLHLPKHG